MGVKVLVADPDRQILRAAFGCLRDQGFRVIAESVPAEALRIARRWRPDLIIVPAPCLQAWDSDPNEGLETILPEFSFLVTANSPDELSCWQRWIGRWCEVLIKPVVHPLELVVAVEDAMKAVRGHMVSGTDETVSIAGRRVPVPNPQEPTGWEGG